MISFERPGLFNFYVSLKPKSQAVSLVLSRSWCKTEASLPRWWPNWVLISWMNVRLVRTTGLGLDLWPLSW